MTYMNRLEALGAEIPHEFFVQKLLDVDKEHMFMRASHSPLSTIGTKIMIVGLEQRLPVRIVQSSTSLAAKDDHQQ